MIIKHRSDEILKNIYAVDRLNFIKITELVLREAQTIPLNTFFFPALNNFDISRGVLFRTFLKKRLAEFILDLHGCLDAEL